MGRTGSHRTILASTLLAWFLGNALAVLFFACLAAVFYLEGIDIRQVLGVMQSPIGITVSALASDLALLGVVYFRIVRPGAISWAAMGVDRKLLPRRLLPGFPLGFALFAVSGAVELLLSGFGIRQTQADIFASVRHASSWEFGLLLLAGAVVAPIVEEIYFRGFVFRGYLDEKGPMQAYIFSSAIFAAIHMNAPALLPIFAMGLLLSFLYSRTGSIVPGMAAHAFNNAAAFLLIYLGLS